MLPRAARALLVLAVPLAISVAIVGGCLAILSGLETKMKVTVENRTSRVLTDGTYGCYGKLSPAESPLRTVPPTASVTGVLQQGSDEMQLHYRVMGVRDDTVDVGYPAESGGTDWTWIVAEGDSLVVDSTVSIRDGNVTYAWSRREDRRRHHGVLAPR